MLEPSAGQPSGLILRERGLTLTRKARRGAVMRARTHEHDQPFVGPSTSLDRCGLGGALPRSLPWTRTQTPAVAMPPARPGVLEHGAQSGAHPTATDHWMGAPRGQASRGDASSSPSALDSPRCEIFPGERRERGRRPALHLSPTRALYVPQGMSKVGVSERGSLATLPAAAGVVHDHSGNGCYRHTSIHTYSCRGGRTNEVEQADESRATACREAS